MGKFKKDKKQIIKDGGDRAFCHVILYGTYNRARDSLLASDVYSAVTSFKHTADDFEEGATSLAILIQSAGKLARMGQIGYVDLVDAAYLYGSDESKPAHGVLIDDAVKEIHDWLAMMKEHFFDEEIKDGDFESALMSINEVKDMCAYFLCTDKFDLSELILEGGETLECMLNKYAEVQDHIALEEDLANFWATFNYKQTEEQ